MGHDQVQKTISLIEKTNVNKETNNKKELNETNVNTKINDNESTNETNVNKDTREQQDVQEQQDDNTQRYDVDSPMLNKELELEQLNDLRKQNGKKVLIGQLNLNSIRNKIDDLSAIVSENLDIFLVSETKLNDNFTTDQFEIGGFDEPYRLDRTKNDGGGGLLLYVRSGIPSKLIRSEDTYEGMFVKVTIKKQKWLICCSYNPHLNNINEHLEKLQISLDAIDIDYNNILVLGDLNCEIEKQPLVDFCEGLNLKAMINLPTCFKNPERPTCIDHMLTNKPNHFQKTAYTITTGISDYHKMTLIILNENFEKLPPKIITYRSYRTFNENSFRMKLNLIINTENIDFESKIHHIVEELDKQAPFKYKTVRGNNMPFMNRDLRKAIMVRSRLKNLYYKSKTNESKARYKRQKNFCLSLLRRTKKDYFANLKESNIIDNKKFWKTVKPLFSSKGSGSTSYTLVDKEEIINDEKRIAQIFNDYYGQIISKLDLPEPPSVAFDETSDHTEMCIQKYRQHPSIIEIKKTEYLNKFSFAKITKEEIEKIIKGLVKNKSQPTSDIPVKIIKKYCEIFSEFLCAAINESLESSSFPNELKLADITPVYKKKGSKNDKGNFRPISILPVLSKIYEKVIHAQVSTYFNDILSDRQFGYRKGMSTQTPLLVMTEIWKKATDEKKKFAALLIDLSKAFDCISHDLLVAKLEAYGFARSALSLIATYLSDRKQRTKIGDYYSTWHNIKEGVPQGSILGPLLFNIYMRDMFYFLAERNVLNYADDTTPFVTADSWEEVGEELSNGAAIIFEWLTQNQMKGNADKSELIANNTSKEIFVTIQNENIFNSNSGKILGLTFDNCLTFEPHINTICKKASQKISALARAAPYMNLKKKKKLMNAFFRSQFNYCPLVWMFHVRRLNKKINHLHERCLRIVYSDHTSTFEQLLEKDGALKFHHKNLQLLAIELFKRKNNISDQTKEIFIHDENIKVNRQTPYFRSREINSVYHGSESLSFLGPKLWELIPVELQDIADLSTFKEEIKQWKPTSCPCRNCRTYIDGVGFL